MLNLALGAVSDDLQECNKVALESGQLVAEPEAHVRRDLVISAPTCVKLSGDRSADDLAKSAFVGGVDILVDTGPDDKSSRFPLAYDLLETTLDLAEFMGRQKPSLRVRSCISYAAANVLCIEGSVEVDRLVVLDHNRIRSASEAAAPELASGRRIILRCHFIAVLSRFRVLSVDVQQRCTEEVTRLV